MDLELVEGSGVRAVGEPITITFSSGGASGTPPRAITQNAGQSVTMPGAGKLNRWDDFFDGWKISGSDKVYFERDKVIFSAGVVLEAQWVGIEGGIA
jgi:hypothetical protein